MKHFLKSIYTKIGIILLIICYIVVSNIDDTYAKNKRVECIVIKKIEPSEDNNSVHGYYYVKLKDIPTNHTFRINVSQDDYDNLKKNEKVAYMLSQSTICPDDNKEFKYIAIPTFLFLFGIISLLIGFFGALLS